jgi:hypothetical protein
VSGIGPGVTAPTASSATMGFLKERLRPMRGLKSSASAAIFVRGHALMRNIRRGFYCIVESVAQRLFLAWSWHRLAEGV